MNVLNLVFSFNTGGIENLLVDTMNGWSESMGQMYLCIINEDYNETLIDKINNKDKVILLDREPGGDKKNYLLEIQSIIASKQIKIVHCHSINALKFLAGSIPYGLKNRYQRYLTIHNVTLVPQFSLVEQIFLKALTHHIFGVSQAVVDEIKTVVKSDKKVSLLYNGIDSSKYQYEKVTKDSSDFKLINVARIFPKMKGQDLLIQAIALLKDDYPQIRCYFAGEPPSDHKDYLQDLKQQVIDLEVEDHIYFLGNCNDVPKLLSEMDLFVLSSRYEGFGIALVEAIIAKCDVVASDLDGPREILKGGELGTLVEPDSVDALCAGIRSCINNPADNKDERKELCLERFSIEHYLKNLYRGYCKEKC